jgi:hypothetical protein
MIVTLFNLLKTFTADDYIPNKALSKYYRSNPKVKGEVEFSIRESTRSSKKNTYTYKGKREKLSEPITYTLPDGNTITKSYKNKLTKVKKVSE